MIPRPRACTKRKLCQTVLMFAKLHTECGVCRLGKEPALKQRTKLPVVRILYVKAVDVWFRHVCMSKLASAMVPSLLNMRNAIMYMPPHVRKTSSSLSTFEGVARLVTLPVGLTVKNWIEVLCALFSRSRPSAIADHVPTKVTPECASLYLKPKRAQ